MTEDELIQHADVELLGTVHIALVRHDQPTAQEANRLLDELDGPTVYDQLVAERGDPLGAAT